MRLLILFREVCGERCGCATVRIDFPQHTGCQRRINNHVFLAPASTPCASDLRQHLRRSSGSGHLLKLAIGEERDVVMVGRPEGIASSYTHLTLPTKRIV